MRKISHPNANLLKLLRDKNNLIVYSFALKSKKKTLLMTFTATYFMPSDLNEKQTKSLIFFGLILVVIFFAIGLVFYSEAIMANLMWIALLAIFAVFAVFGKPVIFLTDYERAVIFRFGKFSRVGGPGWAFKIPLIEDFKSVDLRTMVIDVDKQEVITKDLIELTIDAVLYLKVGNDSESVRKSVVEIKDFSLASQNLLMAGIRDQIGSMNLSEVISSIEILNEELKKHVAKASADWGISVDAVGIQDVTIPPVVMQAMHEEKAAIQEKLARISRAEAHTAEINAVEEAAQKLSDKSIAYYYIKALEEMSKGKGTKLVFPMEFSKLAENIGGSLLGGSGSKKAGPELTDLKKIMREEIDKAVKDAKAKSGKKELTLS